MDKEKERDLGDFELISVERQREKRSESARRGEHFLGPRVSLQIDSLAAAFNPSLCGKAALELRN